MKTKGYGFLSVILVVIIQNSYSLDKNDTAEIISNVIQSCEKPFGKQIVSGSLSAAAIGAGYLVYLSNRASTRDKEIARIENEKLRNEGKPEFYYDGDKYYMAAEYVCGIMAAVFFAVSVTFQIKTINEWKIFIKCRSANPN
jgi:hypothetical protein